MSGSISAVTLSVGSGCQSSSRLVRTETRVANIEITSGVGNTTAQMKCGVVGGRRGECPTETAVQLTRRNWSRDGEIEDDGGSRWFSRAHIRRHLHHLNPTTWLKKAPESPRVVCLACIMYQVIRPQPASLPTLPWRESRMLIECKRYLPSIVLLHLGHRLHLKVILIFHQAISGRTQDFEIPT